MLASVNTLIILIITAVVDISLIVYLAKGTNKNQLSKMFICTLSLLVLWLLGLICQITLSKPLNIEPIYFDYVVYIGACFVPVTVFFIGLIYAKTKIKFKIKYLLLFIIPIISLLVLWTNDFHHLFYQSYSIDFKTNVYGPYINVHSAYSYIMLGIGVFYLLKSTIKSSGILSKQSLLIVLGISIPLITNILGMLKITPMSIYMTPITFTITIIMCTISIFKFQFLGVAPIALQIVVNKISDSYVVLGMYNNIVDFNETFVKTFNLKSKKIKNMDYKALLEETENTASDIQKITQSIKKVDETNKIIHFEQTFKNIKKTFEIEITPINSNGNSLGTLLLFKDITQHKQDMQTIKDKQNLLIESERLASLGQLIGGIAHNLKTPIMSIAGASEGIKDLVNEFDASIGNPIVNDDDFHAIAGDMREWLDKINSYTEYMSDILTAVKGQAVNLSEQTQLDFTIGELFKRVNILMKHELKQAVVYLNMSMKIDEDIIINGDVNSMVQVINNMISNSIQAYNGKPEQSIDMIAWKNDNNKIVITVKDYGPGLPDKVKNKLFKEMITTKGKNGTGLGLYMSYSTIRAHFNGDITVESEEGKGTTFNIILP